MHSLPNCSGVGLKPQHYNEILNNSPDIGWFEIHPENYMCDGGPPHQYLTTIRELYPLSMHGVGMSLGSANGVKEAHLQKLKVLVDRYQPEQVSEHLSWSHWNEVFLNDLLPLPYTEESLSVICDNIDKVQTTLKRNILIENPSIYLDFDKSSFSETDFLKKICERSGCALLMDINNIQVSSFNNDFDSIEYIDNYPIEFAKEIHLAGHAVTDLIDDKKICIDDHGSKVCKEVWKLFSYALSKKKAALPVLIEWDTNIPDFDILLGEAKTAEQHMQTAIQKS